MKFNPYNCNLYLFIKQLSYILQSTIIITCTEIIHKSKVVTLFFHATLDASANAQEIP